MVCSSLMRHFYWVLLGDDIAWMRFDENGDLYGINPEAGFFGVCPGTNMKTNPNAMLTCQKNTIFTNIAETGDGGYFWEGLEDEVDKVSVVYIHATRVWKTVCKECIYKKFNRHFK